jgi:hypothetical protein
MASRAFKIHDKYQLSLVQKLEKIIGPKMFVTLLSMGDSI